MLVYNFDFPQLTNYIFEMLNGEAIDSSPEGAEHGDGEKRNENEGNDEISLWNVKVEERVEEAVSVFCIVE